MFFGYSENLSHVGPIFNSSEYLWNL